MSETNQKSVLKRPTLTPENYDVAKKVDLLMASVKADVQLYENGRYVSLPKFGDITALATQVGVFVYDHPFFQSIAKTAFTDGHHVFLNADFVRALIKEEKESYEETGKHTYSLLPVILHEFYHILFLHHQRCLGLREQLPEQLAGEILNIGFDTAINPRISLAHPDIVFGKTMSEHLGMDDVERYGAMSEEAIVMDLLEHIQDKMPQIKEMRENQAKNKQDADKAEALSREEAIDRAKDNQAQSKGEQEAGDKQSPGQQNQDAGTDAGDSQGPGQDGSDAGASPSGAPGETGQPGEGAGQPGSSAGAGAGSSQPGSAGDAGQSAAEAAAGAGDAISREQASQSAEQRRQTGQPAPGSDSEPKPGDQSSTSASSDDRSTSAGQGQPGSAGGDPGTASGADASGQNNPGSPEGNAADADNADENAESKGNGFTKDGQMVAKDEALAAAMRDAADQFGKERDVYTSREIAKKIEENLHKYPELRNIMDRLQYPPSADAEGHAEKDAKQMDNVRAAVAARQSAERQANCRAPGAHTNDCAEQTLQALDNPQITWKASLRQAVMGDGMEYGIFHDMPDKMFYLDPEMMGINVPIWNPAEIAFECEDTICVLVDTSGSVSDRLLQEFLAEIKGMAEADANINVLLVSADTVIRGEPKYYSADELEASDGLFQMHGRGGTNMRDALINVVESEWGQRRAFSKIVYFGDLEDFPPMRDQLPETMPPVIFIAPEENVTEAWIENTEDYAMTVPMAKGAMIDLAEVEDLASDWQMATGF